MVKILMRADTHVSFSFVPAEEPKAKCTTSQAMRSLLQYKSLMILTKCKSLPQVLAAIAVSMGSMVVGFSSAYTSPALVSMRNTTITSFEVTEQEVSLATVEWKFPLH
jgi:facilitated trehalose transporter